MAFQKAVKAKAKLRGAISGPSGSGKTFTALRIAKGLGGKIALADSEFGSASKYADLFDFDVMDLSSNKHPNEYIKAIKEAEKEGYTTLVIDSITHAWDETKKEVEKKSNAMKTPNSFTSWAVGNKLWQDLEDAIMGSKINILVTMRAKTEYTQEKDNNGRTQVRKVGMAPEVRNGSEYAYDVVLELSHDHMGVVTKTRCNDLDGYCELKPTEALGETLAKWLDSGVEPVEPIKRNPIMVSGNLVNGFFDVDETGKGTVQLTDSLAEIYRRLKDLGITSINFAEFLKSKGKMQQEQYLNTLSEEVSKATIDNWDAVLQTYNKWISK